MPDSEHKPLPDIEETAESNPKIDVGQIREAQALLRELREQGLSRPEYGIVSPYERRPAHVRQVVHRERPAST